MSLVSLATRVIARKFLEGRTWAEDRILDQPADPISQIIPNSNGKGEPVIAIYTQRTTSQPSGQQTQRGPIEQIMMVYIYLPPNSIKLPVGVALQLDGKGAGLALNTMSRQVEMAMHYGNQDWIDLWRKFVVEVKTIKSQFVLIEIESGVRIPCVELSYELDTIPEPDFGKDLYGYWQKLDTELRKTAEGIVFADHIKSLIETPADLQDFDDFRMNFGLTEEAYEASGLAPIVVKADGTAPLLDEVDAPLVPEVGVPSLP